MHVVGIDLGTTNTVVAHASREHPEALSVLPIPQLVAEGEIASKPFLPSVLFAPLPEEVAPDLWGDAPWTVGTYARGRGQRIPGRCVASPKSWLSHAAVDRLAPVLPWGANADDPLLPRLSPVEASRKILGHVRSVFESAIAAPLPSQEIVLTVPASFDEVARELTVRAALEAGLTVRLLEEPLAAFYDYLAQNGTNSLRPLALGGKSEALVLVCDVGGGTTDLTLIRVRSGDSASGALKLDRVAVGRHLLLGGDNMDLALAHAVEHSLVTPPARLAPALFTELAFACRVAKERLLGADAPERLPIRILPTGSRLVGGALSADLSRPEALTTILDGFFPLVDLESTPVRGRGGLVGFGLPYEHDPAITRHVAAFLRRHAPSGDGPHAVLLNGGVFRSSLIRQRLLDCVTRWTGQAPLELSAADPDLAVARGAVAFGLSLHGHGPRVGGGSARGYYVGILSREGARRAVCVVPRGAAEGERHVVSVPGLSLVVGEPVRFDLFASDTAVHPPGEIVTIDSELDALPSMTATFEGKGETAKSRIEVELEGELSAVGTLDVACVERTEAMSNEARRHRLAFDLREAPARKSSLPPTSRRPSDAKLDQARTLIHDAFGRGKADADPRIVRHLVRDLERALGDRPTWTTETARALFDVLVPEARARKRTADHERVFWMMAGYCLRPGYGYPKDGERAGKLLPLFTELIGFPDEVRSFQQFWIAWRRVAGGLLEPAQSKIRDLIDPFLSTDHEKPKRRKGFKPLSPEDMLELAASLERISPSRRGALGKWVLERTWTDRDARLWAALGRIGSRTPTYASAHHVVPPSTVERWLEHLLREKWADVPTAPRAALDMARVTGDRTRDVPEVLRREIAQRLRGVGAPAEWAEAVTELVPIAAADRTEFFGESLPVGLVLGEPLEGTATRGKLT
jgi:molecular chaperone DnaK (HSP70)